MFVSSTDYSLSTQSAAGQACCLSGPDPLFSPTDRKQLSCFHVSPQISWISEDIIALVALFRLFSASLDVFHQKLATCQNPSLSRQTRNLNFWSFMFVLRCLGSKEVNYHWRLDYNYNFPFLHCCVSSNVSSKLATCPQLSFSCPPANKESQLGNLQMQQLLKLQRKILPSF